MAKNAHFKRQYIIQVEGITTNGNAEKFIDNVLFSVVAALDNRFKQVSVKTVPKAE